MSELDMSQYLDLFLQEGNEQLEILEQEVVKLESDPSVERLQIIFRAAHTLKGSSRAMGFTNFAEVTHEMENLLDLLRTNQLPVSSSVIDVLFKCLDALNAIKDQIASGQSDAYECSELVKELQVVSSGASEAGSQSLSQSNESAPASTVTHPELSQDMVESLTLASAERPAYQVDVTLHSECVMKWVRTFMVINAINEIGELLMTFPDAQTLEDEQFDHSFTLYVQTDEDEQSIEAALSDVAELESVSVTKWEPPKDQTSTGSIEPNLEVIAGGSSELADQPATAAVATQNTGPKKAESGQTVRVDVSRLDELMNLVGELVIDRTRVAQIGSVLSNKYDHDDNIDALGEIVGHISRITSDLQDQIMKARMLPIETVFNRFPRMMRDLTQKVGKEVKLEMFGGETELDRSVIEVIGDPLIHILRNSADHGIEKPDVREAAGKPREGTVTISARHQENHIVIEIVDDGKGIDADKIRAKAVESGYMTREAVDRMTDKEALQLIFHSGLSTAEVVSDVSGRGVGMDIVRSNIQRLGGIIDLETTIGKGTKFSLRLPLTLAIIRGLLVEVGSIVYVLPLGSVVETLVLDTEQIQQVHKREVIVLRGLTTPLVRLRSKFVERDSTSQEPQENYVVIVGLADQRVGFVVDRLIGEQEVVIKSLSRFVGDLRGISGATILGDGNVALIIDVNGLVTQEAA